jgi:hypothetical protein
MPLSFTLQCVTTAAILVAGLLALRVARTGAGDPFHLAAWRLAGIGFVVHAADKALQNVLGGIAIEGGKGSAAMRLYLGLAPEMDHSRTFLLMGMFAGLLLLALRRAAPDRAFWRVAAAFMAVGFAAGVGVGYAEGHFATTLHFGRVVLWDVAELLLVLTTMFVLLVTSRADRPLWAFLGAYATSLALGVFWFEIFAYLDVPGSWQAAVWPVHAQRILFNSLMALAAGWRLSIAATGKPVPGMLEVRPTPTLTLR